MSDKRLAIITGGSKGLGKSLVEKYRRENFEVCEFSRSGQSANHIACDFVSPLNTARIIDEALSVFSTKEFSEIVLINNAGTIDPIGPISEFEAESWLNHVNINLNSSIIVSGIFIKHFQNHSGKKVIASISSGAAIRCKAGWSLYCASKAGLEQFCRTLALEQGSGKSSIDIVIIDPNIIDTDMQATIRNSDQLLFPELSRFIGFKEAGQLGSPSAVAEKVFNILAGEIKNGAKYAVEDL